MERNNNMILGPLTKEDAALLKGIIAVTQPRTLLEFGHLMGDSAKVMLEAMTDTAHLHSYDNTIDTKLSDNRFSFHKVCQTMFNPIKADFVFLDASHELELNQKTFEKLQDCMTDLGIIAVHDTGTWEKNRYGDIRGKTINGRFAHCPEEIDFVNWIKETYPEWQQLHLHSNGKDLHGITLLQKYKRL